MIQRERQNLWESSAENGSRLGPYSSMVLRQMESTDNEILSFAHCSHDRFLWLDAVDSLFQARLTTRSYTDYKEVTRDLIGDNHDFQYMARWIGEPGYNNDTIRKVASDYQVVIVNLLNVVFNTDRNSKFRGFIIDHFDEVTVAVSPFNYFFYMNPNFSKYNPVKDCQRLVNLFNETPEEETEFLARYVGYTKHCGYRYAAVPLDDDILHGHLTRAKTFTQFCDRVRQQRNSFEMDEYDAVNDLIQGYLQIEGRIPGLPWEDVGEKEFLAGVDLIVNTKAVIDMFPMHFREKYFDNKLENIYRTRTRHMVEVLGFLLTDAGISPEVVTHLENVAKTGINDDVTQPVIRFGEALYSILAFPEQIFSTYLLQYFSGKIDAKGLDGISGAIEILTEGIRNEEGEPLCNTFGTTLKGLGEQIKSVLGLPDYLQQVPAVLELLRNGILPTRKILDFMRDRKEQALEELNKLRTETAKGNFDPKNEIQKDLDYGKFLNFLQPRLREEELYTQFVTLPYIAEEKIVTLSASERMEAEAAAFEAANLYWFIAQRARLNRRLVVVGNESYGAYFVTEPLRPFLEELGVQVSRYYIHSGGGIIDHDKKGVLQAIQVYLDKENPDDVIIVDGTRNSFSGNIPRLPSALETYHSWFSSKYRVAYLVPIPRAKVFIGTELVDYTPPDFSAPQVILANPIIVPNLFPGFPEQLNEHEPGHFDDVTGNVEEVIVFTTKGVQKIINGRTREQLIELVQMHMINVLPTKIRQTNPLRVI